MAKSNWDIDTYFPFFKGKELTKEESITDYIRRMYARTSQMFEYKNLPKSVDKFQLEYVLQSYGYACAFMNNGELEILRGTLAGEPNKYYLPKQMIITNPALKLSKLYTIGEDCVWFKNDDTWQGLYDMYRKYAYLLSEVDISLKYGAVNSRILSLIGASDDRTYQSAKKILEDVYKGEQVGVVAEKPFLDSLKTYPYGATTNNYIKDLIELRQYIYANWYIELGINANYNMKRESLSKNEVAVNEDTLTPLIDSMLNCRKKAIEEINTLFNQNISVELNSSWRKIDKEIDLEIKGQENEVEAVAIESEAKLESAEQGGEENENKGNE